MKRFEIMLGIRRAFRVAVLGTLALPLSATARADRQPADRPNVLLIMSDDHCTQAISAYGGMLAG